MTLSGKTYLHKRFQEPVPIHIKNSNSRMKILLYPGFFKRLLTLIKKIFGLSLELFALVLDVKLFIRMFDEVRKRSQAC